MMRIGLFEFPENPEEARAWTAYIQRYALARCVLAVAMTRIEGAWIAYCDAVPGQSHANEVQAVLDHGCTLPEAVARALFPEFEGVPYAR